MQDSSQELQKPNPGLSVTYHFCCGLGQITYPLCVPVLVGVQDMVPVMALGDWQFSSSQPYLEDAVLRDSPAAAPLLSDSLTKLLCDSQCCGFSHVFL